MTKYLSLSIVFFFLSCAQVTSLNLKKHQFGRIPTKIIWIQVGGLSPEHIALLKFEKTGTREVSSFEKSVCMGSMWNYDLYDLRPKAEKGFLSQLTGKKDLKNQCEDFRHKPIWKYLSSKNYKIGIFESPASRNQTLTKSNNCKEHIDFLEDTIFWKMDSRKTKNLFHVNEKKSSFKAGEVYHDKSCLSGSCFTSISRNIEATYKAFQKNTNNYLYIVRNFAYMNYLKKNKIKQAKVELQEINSTLNFFQKIAEKNSDGVVRLTSSDAIDLKLPKTGKQWASYEKNANYVRYNNNNLLSPVYAFGARAENFCGTFEQSEVLKRIFSGAKQQGLEFSIINPFE
jgi:hypothetical protein